MAAPPPEGSSPWHQDRPAVGAERLPGQAPAAAPVPRSPNHRRAVSATPGVTPWLWLPVALSSMLLVLFAVMVNRQQTQAQRIGELLGRVQDLEHSRALERTAVLEQQLRAMLNRLQELEKQTKQLQGQNRQLKSMEAELQLLRRTAGRSMLPLEEPSTTLSEPSGTQRSRTESPISP